MPHNRDTHTWTHPGRRDPGWALEIVVNGESGERFQTEKRGKNILCGGHRICKLKTGISRHALFSICMFFKRGDCG